MVDKLHTWSMLTDMLQVSWSSQYPGEDIIEPATKLQPGKDWLLWTTKSLQIFPKNAVSYDAVNIWSF